MTEMMTMWSRDYDYRVDKKGQTMAITASKKKIIKNVTKQMRSTITELARPVAKLVATIPAIVWIIFAATKALVIIVTFW